MRLSLVITTYERPDALAAVLQTVARQTQPPDEIIIADDGSGPATLAVIEAHAREASCPVVHVTQPHDGFRVARLRNLAIARASGDYVVFVDGDMLLHPSFIADHRAAARPGTFMQGVRVRLDVQATKRAIQLRSPPTGPFDAGLGGLRRLYTIHAPAAGRRVSALANRLVAIKSCNQGFWLRDLVAVNGFNEAMVGWGPEDKELCARLMNAGIVRRTLLFGGIAFHLDHPPAARDLEARNVALLEATRATRSTWCASGLDRHRSVPAYDIKAPLPAHPTGDPQCPES